MSTNNAKRGRGRPKGSKNKPKTPESQEKAKALTPLSAVTEERVKELIQQQLQTIVPPPPQVAALKTIPAPPPQEATTHAMEARAQASPEAKRSITSGITQFLRGTELKPGMHVVYEGGICEVRGRGRGGQGVALLDPKSHSYHKVDKENTYTLISPESLWNLFMVSLKNTFGKGQTESFSSVGT